MFFGGTFPTEQNGIITTTAWVNSQNGMTVKQWKIKEVTIGMIACAATVVIVIVQWRTKHWPDFFKGLFLLLPDTKWSSGKLKTSKVRLEMHYHFYHKVLQSGLDQEALRNGAHPHSLTPYADMMAYFNDQLFKTSGDSGQAGVAEDSNEEDPNAAFRRQVEQSLHLGLVEHWSEQAVSISWNCEKYTNTWIWLSSLLRSIPWHHLLFPPMRPTPPTCHQLWRRIPWTIQHQEMLGGSHQGSERSGWSQSS